MNSSFILKRGRARSLPLFFLIGAMLLASGSLWILLRPHRVLLVENITKGVEIFSKPAVPGDNLWIVFVNSVERLPVADHFVVNAARELVFEETIYAAPYAGYVERGTEEIVAPLTVRRHSIGEKMKDLTFFAAYTFRQMLFVNGHFVDLYDKASGGDQIRIRVKSTRRLPLLLERFVPHGDKDL